MLLANLFAAFLEGGTIGILAVAVSVIVDASPVVGSVALEMINNGVDKLFPGIGPSGIFLFFVVAAVGAQISKSLFTYIAKRLSIRIQYKVTRELQERATRHVMSFSYAEVGKHPGGSLVAKIEQTATFAGLVSMLNMTLLSVFMIAIYLVLMMSMSMFLTLIAVLVAIGLAVALKYLITRITTFGKQIASSVVESSRISFEFLQAPRLLRIFNATGHATQAINQARSNLLVPREKSAVIKALVDPVTDCITIAGAGIFLIAGYWVSGEAAKLILPELLLFLVILNRLMPQVKTINHLRLGVAGSLPMVRMVMDFLETKTKTFLNEGGQEEASFRNQLSFRGVSFAYINANDVVLRNINCSIKYGQTVAIVGSSGAGKSTLVDLLIGLHVVDSGEILVDGVNLVDLKRKDWLRLIGVVDQETFLLNASVRDNICFGSTVSEELMISTAVTARAHEFIMDLPQQYETFIGDRGFMLSGGQRQRLALTRALVREPEILILDEATSALDSETEREIQATLEALHGMKTIILIAHRLATVARADRVLVLESGRLVEDGTVEELRNGGGRFAQLWEMQSLDTLQTTGVSYRGV